MERFHDMGAKPEAHPQGIWALQPIPGAYSDGVGNIITGGSDGELRTWIFNDVVNGGADDEMDSEKPPVSEVSTFSRHSLPIVQLSVAAKTPYAASTSLDGAVKLWDLSEKAEPKTLQLLKATETWDLALTANAEKLITGGVEGAIKVIDIHDNATSALYNVTGEGSEMKEANRPGKPMVMSIAISEDETKIAAGASDGSVAVLDVETGKKVCGTMQRHGGAVRSISFLPSEPGTVVSASDDQLINFHDARTGHVTGSCVGHQGLVLSANGSSDGKYLASGSSDCTVKIWDRVMKNVLFNYKRHDDSVWGTCYAANNTRAVSVGDDARICVIDTSKADVVS